MDEAQMRVGWDDYFMNIAKQAATRATCRRKCVGAVVVVDRNVVATGYNGSISGFPHCTDTECIMEDGHCVATIHAEMNTIAQAAKRGVSVNGGTLYTTASPCWPCFKVLANSGIRRIVYGEFYRDARSFAAAKDAGISLEMLD